MAFYNIHSIVYLSLPTPFCFLMRFLGTKLWSSWLGTLLNELSSQIHTWCFISIFLASLNTFRNSPLQGIKQRVKISKIWLHSGFPLLWILFLPTWCQFSLNTFYLSLKNLPCFHFTYRTISSLPLKNTVKTNPRLLCIKGFYGMCKHYYCPGDAVWLLLIWHCAMIRNMLLGRYPFLQNTLKSEWGLWN